MQKPSIDRTTEMDKLSYVYEDQNTGSGAVRRTNRLLYVTDAVTDNNYANDINDQVHKGQSVAINQDRRLYNYDYDAIGNLTQDLQDGIENIEWNVQNKVQRVVKNNGPDLAFGYSADGNRLMKEVRFNTPGSTVSSELIKRTYYIRDASGNVMANYQVTVLQEDTDTYTEKMNVNEHNIYGSSMCGQYHHQAGESSQLSTQQYTGTENADGTITPIAYTTVPQTVIPEQASILGQRHYQGANHLGNVLVVFTDRKTQIEGANGMVSGYKAEVMSASDYYPFGMLMPDRNENSDDYRYGFNGKERDDEINTAGGAYDFGARIYDSRIGRWSGVDKLHTKFSSWSSYNFVLDSPLRFIDPDGYDVIVAFTGGATGGAEKIDLENVSASETTGSIVKTVRDKAISTGREVDALAIRSGATAGASVQKAYDFIKKNYTEGERVLLYGYSYGGDFAVELAEKLGKESITVDLLITVDGADGPFKGSTVDRTIPPNVTMNVNEYQTKHSPIGSRGDKNEADDEEKTKVFNINVADYNKDVHHGSIDEVSADYNVMLMETILNSFDGERAENPFEYDGEIDGSAKSSVRSGSNSSSGSSSGSSFDHSSESSSGSDSSGSSSSSQGSSDSSGESTSSLSGG